MGVRHPSIKDLSYLFLFFYNGRRICWCWWRLCLSNRYFFLHTFHWMIIGISVVSARVTVTVARKLSAASARSTESPTASVKSTTSAQRTTSFIVHQSTTRTTTISVSILAFWELRHPTFSFVTIRYNINIINLIWLLRTQTRLFCDYKIIILLSNWIDWLAFNATFSIIVASLCRSDFIGGENRNVLVN